MHPKDADGLANSVDPDQTASLEYIEFVRYIVQVRKKWMCTTSRDLCLCVHLHSVVRTFTLES